MISSFLFSLLCALCIAQKQVSFSEPGTCIKINKGISGVNAALERESFAYNNSIVSYYFRSRNISSIRFPGGSATKSYDWETGKSFCPPDVNCTSLCSPEITDSNGCGKWFPSCEAHNNIEDNLVKFYKNEVDAKFRNLNIRRKYKSMPVGELIGLLDDTQWDGNIVFVINPITYTLDKTRRIVQYFLDLFESRYPGIDPVSRIHFEVGNELYFYRFFTPNSTVYDDIARPHAREIKSINPRFQVAALVSGPPWNGWYNATIEEYLLNPTLPFNDRTYANWKQTRIGWNLVFPKAGFRECAVNGLPLYDAVTLHLYPQTYQPKENEDPTEVDVKQHNMAVTQMDSRFDKLMADVAYQFGVPIWVTEWDLGFSSRNYFGALQRALFSMYIVTLSDVTVANFHFLNGMLGVKNINNAQCLYAEDYDGGPILGSEEEQEAEFFRRTDVVRAFDIHAVIFGKLIKQCSTATRLEFDSVDSYVAADEFGGKLYPELFGVLFECGKYVRMVVLSKHNTSYSLNISTIPNLIADEAFATTYTQNPVDNKDYISESKVKEPGLDFISVPEYSVVVIENLAATSDICESSISAISTKCTNA